MERRGVGGWRPLLSSLGRGTKLFHRYARKNTHTHAHHESTPLNTMENENPFVVA